MRKKLQIMFMLAMFAIAEMGCNLSESESHDNQEGEIVNIELTERQIALLKEMGLPTDYEELSLNQKSAIESIEDLLCYLEDKYEQPFTYVGYIAGDALENEHLVAYPSDGSPDDEIKVYRTYVNKVYRYEDNYATVLAKPFFEERINEFVSENINILNKKVFCKVTLANENVTKENVFGNVAGSVYIFLDEAYCTQEEYQIFLDKCERFLSENSSGMPYSIWVTRTEEIYLQTINKENFENKLSEDIHICKDACTISSSGKLKRY